MHPASPGGKWDSLELNIDEDMEVSVDVPINTDPKGLLGLRCSAGSLGMGSSMVNDGPRVFEKAFPDAMNVNGWTPMDLVNEVVCVRRGMVVGRLVGQHL